MGSSLQSQAERDRRADESWDRVVAAREPAAAVRLLRRVEPHAVDGSMAEDMAAGCELMDVIEDGNVVGAIAVEVRGEVATIKAAVNTGANTYAALLLLEAQLKARGVRFVGMFTKRAGLVRRLINTGGYGLVQAELIKEI
jgi:hypothetical protein